MTEGKETAWHARALGSALVLFWAVVADAAVARIEWKAVRTLTTGDDVPQFTMSVENFQVDGEDLSYERVTDLSNTVPSESAAIPKLAYAGYDARRGVIDVEVGKFVGEFGKARTVHETTAEAVNAIATIVGQTDTDGQPVTDVSFAYLPTTKGEK